MRATEAKLLDYNKSPQFIGKTLELMLEGEPSVIGSADRLNDLHVTRAKIEGARKEPVEETAA